MSLFTDRHVIKRIGLCIRCSTVLGEQLTLKAIFYLIEFGSFHLANWRIGQYSICITLSFLYVYTWIYSNFSSPVRIVTRQLFTARFYCMVICRQPTNIHTFKSRLKPAYTCTVHIVYSKVECSAIVAHCMHDQTTLADPRPCQWVWGFITQQYCNYIKHLQFARCLMHACLTGHIAWYCFRWMLLRFAEGYI